MNKSAAGSCYVSYCYTGISASGIGGGYGGSGWGERVGWQHHLGEGSLCQLITERVNFVVFPHIAAASPKCTVRYTIVFSFSSLLQDACFQSILLQYARPWRIMWQAQGVRRI